MKRWPGILLVGLQLVGMVYLACTGPWWPGGWGERILLVGSVWLGVVAVVALRWRYLRAVPEPHPEGILCTAGPYRYVRHPMYTAVLGAGLALVLAGFSWMRLAVWAGLWVILRVKIRIEERLLEARYADYAAYRLQTGALLPMPGRSYHRRLPG